MPIISGAESEFGRLVVEEFNRRAQRVVDLGQAAPDAEDEGGPLMAIMVTDLDFETADALLQATDRLEALTVLEFCSMMTRRLGLLAGIVPRDLPEPAPFELPPILAG